MKITLTPSDDAGKAGKSHKAKHAATRGEGKASDSGSSSGSHKGRSPPESPPRSRSPPSGPRVDRNTGKHAAGRGRGENAAVAAANATSDAQDGAGRTNPDPLVGENQSINTGNALTPNTVFTKWLSTEARDKREWWLYTGFLIFLGAVGVTIVDALYLIGYSSAAAATIVATCVIVFQGLHIVAALGSAYPLQRMYRDTKAPSDMAILCTVPERAGDDHDDYKRRHMSRALIAMVGTFALSVAEDFVYVGAVAGCQAHYYDDKVSGGLYRGASLLQKTSQMLLLYSLMTRGAIPIPWKPREHADPSIHNAYIDNAKPGQPEPGLTMVLVACAALSVMMLADTTVTHSMDKCLESFFPTYLACVVVAVRCGSVAFRLESALYIVSYLIANASVSDASDAAEETDDVETGDAALHRTRSTGGGDHSSAGGGAPQSESPTSVAPLAGAGATTYGTSATLPRGDAASATSTSPLLGETESIPRVNAAGSVIHSLQRAYSATVGHAARSAKQERKEDQPWESTVDRDFSGAAVGAESPCIGVVWRSAMALFTLVVAALCVLHIAVGHHDGDCTHRLAALSTPALYCGAAAVVSGIAVVCAIVRPLIGLCRGASVASRTVFWLHLEGSKGISVRDKVPAFLLLITVVYHGLEGAIAAASPNLQDIPGSDPCDHNVRLWYAVAQWTQMAGAGALWLFTSIEVPDYRTTTRAEVKSKAQKIVRDCYRLEAIVALSASALIVTVLNEDQLAFYPHRSGANALFWMLPIAFTFRVSCLASALQLRRKVRRDAAEWRLD